MRVLAFLQIQNGGGTVVGEVLTERVWCLKSCYNLQRKYGAIGAVGANLANGGGGDGGRQRYSCNMIRLKNKSSKPSTKLLQEKGYHITQYN